jgi:hypothetical protein
MNGDATARLPAETMASIFKICIKDHFSTSRDPYSPPPAPLRVCKRWKEIAINNPRCWTHLDFSIDTKSKCGYTRTNKSQKPTKGKATQDALARYFRYAGNLPVHLSIGFWPHYTKDCEKKLIPWLVENFPIFRSYHQSGTDKGFAMCWLQFSPMTLMTLTHLRVGEGGVKELLEQDPTLSFAAPNLLYAHFEVASKILPFVEAPKLKCLVVGCWNSPTMELLDKFPLLEDLVLETHFFGPLSDFRNEGLRRVILRHRDPLYTQLGEYEIPDSWKHFILHSRTAFPNVTSWQMDVFAAMRLFLTDLVPWVIFHSLGTLLVLSSNLDHDVRFLIPNDPDIRIIYRLLKFWVHVPNLTHVVLGVTASGWEPEISDWEYKLYSGRWLSFQIQIVHSLGTSPYIEGAGTILPSLKQLEVADLTLDPKSIIALGNVLHARNREQVGNADPERCTLTLRRCILEASKAYLPRCFEVQQITFGTFPEFADFATVLQGCDYFTDIDVPSTWNLPVPVTEQLPAIETQA